MPYYPYVVHQPANYPLGATPPALVMLGGTGSRGSDVNMLKEWSTWNGSGKRLKEYLIGNETFAEAAKTVGEQFLVITLIAPNETSTEWRTEDIKPVLADAASKYQFDQDRLYLAGFSMGAREAWRLLKDDPNYWAAAVMCAGEPEDTVGLEALVNMPIHHYQGEQDFVSPAEHAYKAQEALEAAGSTSITLTVVPGVAHNSMADAPWQQEMFAWLLEQNKNNHTTLAIPASAVSASGSSIPSDVEETVSGAVQPATTDGAALGAVDQPESSALQTSLSLLLVGASAFAVSLIA